MSDSLFQRFTNWLCLWVTLLMAIAPGQTFVLCLEPHGGAVFEVATADARCGGCLDAGSESSGAPSIALRHDADCSCIDITVIAGGDESKLAPIAVQIDLHAAAPLRHELVTKTAPSGVCERIRATEPRAPPALASIRSVVLLV